VYRARDPRLGRDVAIKILPEAFSADLDRLRRFEYEAKATAALNHPNILAVYDIGETDGVPYVVSELLEGETLRQLLEGGALTTRKAIDYGTQTASGLAAAHEKGIVHRDIKPENIFVTESGLVKVLDFGLARRMELDEFGESLVAGSTIAGRPIGTANYMAPERILQMPLDPRCDLFSLGVVIYEMATGRLPFAAASPADTVTNVLEKDPVPVTTLSADRPARLQHIVDRLLAKNADDRYQSATELRAALESVTGDRGRRIWQRLFKN